MTERLGSRLSAKIATFSRGRVWSGNRLVWECSHLHTADDKHTAEFYAIQCATARLLEIKEGGQSGWLINER